MAENTFHHPVNTSPTPLGGLLGDTEPYLQKIATPTTSDFKFRIDGVSYNATYSAENGRRLEIWAVLGYLPYTAESPQRRKMIIAILNAAQHMRDVKIGVNSEHQIIVTMSCDTNEIQPQTFIFPPLVRFMQEAAPYIRLIGQYL